MSTITAKFIEDNHPKVKELMLNRQVEQGYPRNWDVFEKSAATCILGFAWAATPEGEDPWNEAIFNGNFAPLYALHPEWGATEPAPRYELHLEWGEPKQEEPAQFIDGEKLLADLRRRLEKSKQLTQSFDEVGSLWRDGMESGLETAIEQVEKYIRGESQPATDSETIKPEL